MNQRQTSQHDRRDAGFTLVELLVAVSVLLVLAGVTVATLNYSAEQEKISNSARDIQTYLKGARDRAIFRRIPTGVRLVLDQNGPLNAAGNPRTANGMVYIGTPEVFGGELSIDMRDQRTLILITSGGDGVPGEEDNPATTMINEGDDDGMNGPDDHTDEFFENPPSTVGWDGDPIDQDVTAEWERLENLGLLSAGLEIELKPVGGEWLRFTLGRNNGSVVPLTPFTQWRLTTEWPAGPTNVGAHVDVEFRISLRPAILPNQQPRELARGVVIDLDACRLAGTIPSSWYNSGTNSYRQYLDILFSPLGVGFGQWTSEGQIQLVLADVGDVEQGAFSPTNTNYLNRENIGRERIISINALSGNISLTSLNPELNTAGNALVDPFLYAETGVRAP